MTIRAKFYCSEVVRSTHGPGNAIEGETVKFAAVYGDENKPWSKFTPSGQLSMHITNPDAIGQFEPGKTYFLDITPADVPAGVGG